MILAALGELLEPLVTIAVLMGVFALWTGACWLLGRLIHPRRR